MAHTITLIPGDGIGPELAEATTRVLDATGIGFEWESVVAGEAAIEAYGTPLPDHVLESVRRTGVGLKGPITTPVGGGFRSVNVGLRQALGLYANLRPAKSMRGVESRYEDVDLIIVRENTEDLYAGIEHMVGPDAAESIKIITRAASERIARYAFEYAVANGRHKVTAVHKANIMKLSDGLFLESCRTVAADYEGKIEFEDRIVDNMCMQLVQKPELYDVMVLPNLYGDIVSDLCAGLVGGLGVAPGANIGTDAAVFEPVHGSAPKYAGLDRANPTAMILSGALMLRHLGHPDVAATLEGAVREVIAEGTLDDLRPGRLDRHAGLRGRGDRPPDRHAGGSMTGLPATLRIPRKPPGTAPVGLGITRRVDRWWIAPGVQGALFTICATYLFISGILLTPLFGTPYEVDGYLSPLFSPLITPDWLPTWFSPGIFILWIPLGFRATCYYYRKAYYRFYFADPPGCAVGEPPIHHRYRMETVLPFVLQNAHRFFLYLAFVPLFFLWVDAAQSLRVDGQWRIGLGVFILGFNALLLSGYSFSCHSLRHLVGGRIDCFSCTRRTQVRHGMWQRLTSLNRHHMAWAWASLITVTLADVYVRLLALGVITDPAIRF